MKLDEKVAESAGFPKVYFATTEPLEDAFSLAGDLVGAHVGLIAGSGDPVISALVRGSRVVDTVDISSDALQWSRLKIACAGQLDDASYGNLMRALNPNQKEMFDFSHAKRAFDSLSLLEDLHLRFYQFFLSEESLAERRESFFYTTRNYLPRLSPHSFFRPSVPKHWTVQFKMGDIRTALAGSYDYIHLSNILDVFFTEGWHVRFHQDGSPDYEDMPSTGDTLERRMRTAFLRKQRGHLREGGRLTSISFGYFRPFVPDFIIAGEDAGFKVTHKEVESDVYGPLMDHIFLYEKK